MRETSTKRIKADRSFRILAVLVALALFLAITLAFLYVRQVMERNRAMIEFHVFRVMTGILDEYSGSGHFDATLWPGLDGFALYGEDGSPLMRYGSAPERLSDTGKIPFPGISDLSGSSMTILRRTGGGPDADYPSPPDAGRKGFRRDMGLMMGFARHGPGPSPRMGPLRGDGPGMNDRGSALASPSGLIKGFVFIDYGVAGMLRDANLALVFVACFLAAFFSIVTLLVVYSRKLVAYRERERETAQLVQLGEAARTLAHEIKNPLGVIRVQCATLKRTLPEERSRNISVIEEETGRLAHLTERLRDFLSSSTGNPAYRDPASFLAECARRYGESVSVASYDGHSSSVFIDPERMLQVLDNLIANARESIEAAREQAALSREEARLAGSVADVRAEEASSLTVAATPDLPELSLTVRRGIATFAVADRGVGISEEKKGRVFEPFFTTKARGTGIGLALSRRFMEQAGGTLSFAARQGGGCVFSASLPLAKGE